MVLRPIHSLKKELNDSDVRLQLQSLLMTCDRDFLITVDGKEVSLFKSICMHLCRFIWVLYFATRGILKPRLGGCNARTLGD